MNKIIRTLSIVFLVFVAASPTFEKKEKIEGLVNDINHLFERKNRNAFSGVVLISEADSILFLKSYGDSEKSVKKCAVEDNFIIGSVSKMLTSVMVLKEYEKGSIHLNDPISKYLPELKMAWKDSVQIIHLLNHTHGIDKIDKPLLFKPGSKLHYSNVGYQLLSTILEKITGKSFKDISNQFFVSSHMKNTFYPDLSDTLKIVNGYTNWKNKQKKISFKEFKNVASSSFVSNAEDLMYWNNQLHNGHILNDSTYQLFIQTSDYAVRKHLLFGKTSYGLGITVSKLNKEVQLGLTGYIPGYLSTVFYFKKSKLNVIILENMDHYESTKKSFKMHLDVLEYVLAYLKTIE